MIVNVTLTALPQKPAGTILSSRAERHYPLIRHAGCKLNWIFLAGPWDIDRSARTQEALDAAMAKCPSIAKQTKPIAVAHHGVYTDRLWRAGKLDRVQEFIHRMHDAGFVAGVSTHNPRVVEEVESKGWPADFYMTCFYCISREPEDFVKEIGVEPVGETYLATDPERMCKIVQKTSKTCLAFKILAAGRKCNSPEQVREAFEFAFRNIKPTDGVIVGMFPKFSDQVRENVRLARELGAGINPPDFIRRYGDRIIFLHLRDQNADGTWSEALGEGVMDYVAIGKALREVNFSGDAMIELAHERGFKLTRPLRETWKMSREYVRKTLGF